jgi:hypothetical protein
MAITRTNRVALDGTTVTVTFGRQIVRLLAQSYSDSLETESGSHMGSQAIDYRTPGIYKTEQVSLKVESAEFREFILPLFQFDGFGNEKFPIVVGYSHPDIGYDSDMLDLCRVVNMAQATENSAKAFETELKLTTDQIYWGEERKTINKRDLSTPLGPSQF